MSDTNPRGRVRLRTETERKLADIDARSAVCYADAEALAAQISDYASQIDSSDDAIPNVVDALEETSAVHHVEHLRQHVSTTER